MEYSLRELSKADLPIINQWRNDKALVDLLGNNFFYIATEVDEQWYEQYLKSRQQNIRLAIAAKDTPSLIGTVQLTNIHRVNQSAEFSIMIGNRDFWSKGAGYFATTSIIDHGFRDLNLNRIYLTVLQTNPRAIALYEKAGFKHEGVLREAIFKNEKFIDLVQMSILRKDKFQKI